MSTRSTMQWNNEVHDSNLQRLPERTIYTRGPRNYSLL